jgi:hypothetical protein
VRITRTLAVLVGVTVLGAAPPAVANFDGGPSSSQPGTQAPSDTMLPMHARQVSRSGRAQVRGMRRATRRFHNLATAESAGYGLLKDLKGISCIAEPGMGAMGVHYVNPKLVANPAIHPKAPEALVYAPGRDGTLHLAALEFIVDKAAWDAGHHGRPQLFRGHRFDGTSAPNRYGLAPFYSQHVWIWKHNSAGLLAMWNPAVHCARPHRVRARDVHTTWDRPTRPGSVRAV